jgi:hypothetical protein
MTRRFGDWQRDAFYWLMTWLVMPILLLCLVLACTGLVALILWALYVLVTKGVTG